MSGDDGLREALAAVICPGIYCESHGECLEDADAVLALPELAALRAKANAANRVRELAEEYERRAALDADPACLDARINRMAADRIRRALDGDQR